MNIMMPLKASRSYNAAYLGLFNIQRIYRDKLQKIKANSHLAAIDFSIVGLMDEAKDELRLLGGWSHNSHMPDLYAKRFLSQQANTAIFSEL
ncbi:Phage integrase [Escherichia coli]|uniref:Phage integrase n=1 Tax=Escherichia coli TaxID=562 RepID=A0A377BFR1_ECOLX|nr:Phage integrase [Escherichia coli]